MNHRRNRNIVPVAALLRWIVASAFLCVVGLGYVYFKNQMQSTGSEIRNLESQIAQVEMQDDVVRAQISKLSSRSYLQRRLAEGFIRMTPITDDHIVRLGGARTAWNRGGSNNSADGLRQVSNQIAAP
jgi:hypothetical protein